MVTRKNSLSSRGQPQVLPERIEQIILLLRGEKVMLSPDLARLYGVAPRALVQAVKRNAERFPADFMFQLTNEETDNVKSQFVTSSWGGARRARPMHSRSWGLPCSPASFEVNGPSGSTLRLCGPLSASAGSWRPMRTLPASWKHWRKNMTLNSE